MEETVSKPVETYKPKESEIESRIKETLKRIIDPETGLDILRMGLVKNTHIEDGEKEKR